MPKIGRICAETRVYAGMPPGRYPRHSRNAPRLTRCAESERRLPSVPKGADGQARPKAAIRSSPMLHGSAPEAAFRCVMQRFMQPLWSGPRTKLPSARKPQIAEGSRPTLTFVVSDGQSRPKKITPPSLSMPPSRAATLGGFTKVIRAHRADGLAPLRHAIFRFDDGESCSAPSVQSHGLSHTVF